MINVSCFREEKYAKSEQKTMMILEPVKKIMNSFLRSF